MKISDILKTRMSFSFEVFPPKFDKPVEPLLDTLEHLYAFKPDFISCTYGAGGTNKGRNGDICSTIKKRGACEVLTHFTCIGNTRDDIAKYVREYADMGLENMLALRGDLPAGWTGTNGDFAHADELIAFLREQCPDFCIGAACYPEKHIQAVAFANDIAHLRSKMNNGASFLMSQLCYDLTAYERFMERIRKAGITLPVVVGIMPVLVKDGALRMTLNNGCSIPRELASIFGKYGDDPESFRKAGKDYTVQLIYDYMNLGIDGLHIYTLNRWQDVSDILNQSGVRSSI